MSKKKYIIDGFGADVEMSESEIIDSVRRKISACGIKKDAYDICLYKKSVDETGFIGYNGVNIKNKGCEEKSRHKDAVQRAPVGVMGYG